MTNSTTNLPLQGQRILITGGTGLVGQRLSKLLAENHFEVSHLSRNPTKGTYESFYWNVEKGEIDKEAIKNSDIIIHLAGASVAGKRWTKKWKQEIYDSRINATRLLVEAIRNHNSRLQHFISASAIGYYGWDTGQNLVDESSEKGKGFLADVVADWEKEVSNLDEFGVKNSIARVGIVLSDKGAALVEMMKPIKLGIGAPLGSGKQFMSWIHIDDLCQLFIHMINSGEAGVFNAVAPNPVTNKDFTKQLAKAVNKPLILPNVPSFALRLLVGEMQVMLTGGNKVSSKKIEQTGFDFQYPSLDSALKNLVK
ncbi:MAG: TIGR01777 family oxidoreductase [Cyclobacteriaceae bacterium]